MSAPQPFLKRVVLAGDTRAAAMVLDVLLDLVPASAVLVIAPERPSSSWHYDFSSHAKAHGVRVVHGEGSDESISREIKGHQANLLLNVYFGSTFEPVVLAAVNGPCLGFHPSLLPRHRGTGPVIWAVAEGDRLTGLSVHRLDASAQGGDLLVQRPLPVHPDETAYELHGKMAYLVRATAAALLRDYASTGVLPESFPQQGSASSHRADDPSINHLDWSQGSERIRNTVRALANPLPGAYALVDKKRVIIERLTVARTGSALQPKAPGMVEVPDNDGSPLVWASDGLLSLDAYRHDGEVRPGRELCDTHGLREGVMLR